MAAIEIGNDRTVPINERRARVDGVLISLETEGMDDRPHLYPEAQDKERTESPKKSTLLRLLQS